MGARNDGMHNICELFLNVVIFDRPKMLIGLSQKARGRDKTLCFCFTRSLIPSADRQTLTHHVESVEHGKPNYLHLSMESEPQGELIGKWVKEVGESECSSVMGLIPVAVLQDRKLHYRARK